ncbi:class I SAM-dependent methyltransferase [Aeromicrobium sp.]|uniref:class I SAM-dependent methyltransferase n=1 Tax=Aeromicrobium sp. TaxID=1871063 RepID=UPI003D6C6532
MDLTSAETWDERYRESDRIWSGRPNPQLVAEAADLPPGRALDVGCGEGADAIWLAERGWTVVGTDISQVALDRAERHSPPALADRITWRQTDLVTEPPEPEGFDLVAAHFMHLPPGPRAAMFRGLVAAVRSGGLLLMVGHDVREVHTGPGRHQGPDVYFTADELTDLLATDWHVEVSEMRRRPAGDAHGHDLVFRARRG